VPISLGAHNARIDAARELLSKKGRAQQRRFAFEGPTLLHEAREAGIEIEALYVTQAAFDAQPLVQKLERDGADVFVIDERSMRRISDLQTPPGILAIAPLALSTAARVLSAPGTVLLLADVNDPGNVGTLLRTAEAFGASGVLAGSLGAELHQPKVVRAAMGSLFRLPLAVCEPEELRGLLSGWEVTGLSARGAALESLKWQAHNLLAIGNERHGLGRWEPLCGRAAAIPMRGPAESLNAAVAGAIALYEATKRSFP
jgi:TrmH family RNA methyltransferase